MGIWASIPSLILTSLEGKREAELDMEQRRKRFQVWLFNQILNFENNFVVMQNIEIDLDSSFFNS